MELYMKPGKLDALDVGAHLQIVGADLLSVGGKKVSHLATLGETDSLTSPSSSLPIILKTITVRRSARRLSTQGC